jgi:hypothetical protein
MHSTLEIWDETKRHRSISSISNSARLHYKSRLKHSLYYNAASIRVRLTVILCLIFMHASRKVARLRVACNINVARCQAARWRAARLHAATDHPTVNAAYFTAFTAVKSFKSGSHLVSATSV